MNTIQTTKRGILFFRGNSIDIYEPSIPKIVTLQISNDTLSDMEIVDQKNLETLVQSILSANKFSPTQFFLILESPVFTKEFTTGKQDQIITAIEAFLDSVPFENVLSKQIATQKGQLVIATNGGLYDGLRKAFVLANCSIECITPILSLDSRVNKEKTLTQSTASYLYNNLQTVRQNAFSSVIQKSNVDYELAPTLDKPKEKSSLPLLIPVFGILILVLIYVYTQSNKQTPNLNKQPTQVELSITPSPSPYMDGKTTPTSAK